MMEAFFMKKKVVEIFVNSLLKFKKKNVKILKLVMLKHLKNSKKRVKNQKY